MNNDPVTRSREGGRLPSDAKQDLGTLAMGGTELSVFDSQRDSMPTASFFRIDHRASGEDAAHERYEYNNTHYNDQEAFSD